MGYGDVMRRGKQDPAFVLVCALLLLGPSIFALTTFERDPSFTWFQYFGVPIALMEGAIIAAAAFAGFRPRKAFARLTPLTRWSAVTFVASISLSTMWSPVIFIAAGHILLTLLHLLVAIALWDRLSLRWQGRSSYILAALAGGAVLYTFVVYVLLLSVREFPTFDWLHYGAGGMHVRHLGYYAMISGGIGAGILAAERGRSWSVFGVISLSVGIGLATWSGSRGGFFALLACMPFVPLLANRGARARSLGLAMLAWAIGIALAVIWTPPHPAWGLDRILAKLLQDSDTVEEFTTGRHLLWAGAWRGIVSQPIFGFGEGQFLFVTNGAWGGSFHPHNAPLQLLFQWGVMGTAALVILCRGALVWMRRPLSYLTTSALPAFFGILATAVISLIDGPLAYAYPTAAFVICLVALAAETGTRLPSA